VTRVIIHGGGFRMKIGITVWDERISPVFDSAHELLIADVKNQQIKNLSRESFDPQSEGRLVQELTRLKIEVLICGAISENQSTVIEDSGIHLIPFINGNANQILGEYASGRTISPVFLMPGCGQGDLAG
jgi:predicted Fe-Mo cluster-binding NifX family protein